LRLDKNQSVNPLNPKQPRIFKIRIFWLLTAKKVQTSLLILKLFLLNYGPEYCIVFGSILAFERQEYEWSL